MRSIGAAIIILAGAILLTGGAHVPQHSDGQFFVQAVGCGVGLLGLKEWFTAPKS